MRYSTRAIYCQVLGAFGFKVVLESQIKTQDEQAQVKDKTTAIKKNNTKTIVYRLETE